ncbi:MAG TPA: dihydropteroate synthase [Acidobacteriaceae bacterium]
MRTVVMGILNVTPDSFSDGGRFFAQDKAADHALRMLDEGADLIDIGGESTRPGSTAISPPEEQARVLPVVRQVLAARSGAILSIDTYHAETARMAVEEGVEIVNDVSGHLWDPEMAATCSALGCGNVLMHTRGRPSEWRTQPRLAADEVLPLVLRGLRARADAALAAGIARETIVLDPGFGFGKIMDENLPLLASFAELCSLGFPLLAGLSRKSFLARLRERTHPSLVIPQRSTLAADAEESASLPVAQIGSEIGPDLATSAANMAALLAGAHILRVHEVGPARQVAGIADRLLAAANSSHS